MLAVFTATFCSEHVKHDLEITKTCTAALMKAKTFIDFSMQKKRVSIWETEDGENIFFKALAN